jgi:hypothetical protein
MWWLGYQLEDSGFESRQKRKIFILAKVHSASGENMFSYLIGIGIFPSGKAVGA